MLKSTLSILVLLITSYGTCAQSGNEISKNFDIIIFPAADQDAEKQEYDEYKCYKWAANNTNYDPMKPQEKVDASKLGADGSTIKGAAGGALLGAIIGGIAGDTKKGLKIGAATGGIGAGIEKAKRDAKIKKAIAEQEKQNQENLLKFKKAFCACMDAKDYKATY